MSRSAPSGVPGIAAFAFSIIAGLASASLAGAAPASAAYSGVDPATFATIRSDFYEAAGSIDATRESISALEAQYPGEPEARPPIIRAYRAMLEGLLGKHDPNPAVKLARVNRAISEYGGLVETYPDSLEMRFLRYAFYSQLPGLFGVSKYVRPDLDAILAMYDRGGDGLVPPLQLRDMAGWLAAEGKLGAEDRARLDKAVAALKR